MQPLSFVLGVPLVGCVVLALWGHRGVARDLNVAFSLGTFVAACVLTVQIGKAERAKPRKVKIETT